MSADAMAEIRRQIGSVLALRVARGELVTVSDARELLATVYRVPHPKASLEAIEIMKTLRACTGCGSPNCSHLWPSYRKCCPDCSHVEPAGES